MRFTIAFAIPILLLLTLDATRVHEYIPGSVDSNTWHLLWVWEAAPPDCDLEWATCTRLTFRPIVLLGLLAWSAYTIFDARGGGEAS
jgi:hypothetical protein